MAQFAILLYSPAPADPLDLTPEFLAELEAYPAQVASLGGTLVTGFALQPSTTAKSVRPSGVTDGPFAEAKEVVAGFFVLDAPDLATAVRIAEAHPVAESDGPRGGVEVRPLFVPPSG